MAFMGRSFVLQSFNAGNWVTVMGLKATGANLQAAVVDTTSSKSFGWRQILPDNGNQFVTITASGVFKDSPAEEQVLNGFFSRQLNSYRILFENGYNIWGLWKVSKLEYTGDYNGAVMYSITLESSGIIHFSPFN